MNKNDKELLELYKNLDLSPEHMLILSLLHGEGSNMDRLDQLLNIQEGGEND